MSKTVSNNRVREFLPNNWNDVDALLGQFFGPTYAGVKAASQSGRSPIAPASFWEADNSFHVEVDLPGVSREDVEITFDKGELKIAAERKAFEGERAGLVEERVYGKVERSVTLPDSVDADSIEAKFTDGVLSVTIAKIPEVQPKRIDIQ
ncbi:Hsp20/alpha crystallin family protein [Adhaeretor mobilis]|uniref:Spore protein SP21 n=1 Tax=Adhaeretor mobilis TaxID=1930276 RepID=A0A517MQV9_9BACT|nr:Hsp20/alpha crystallin family protein [Adhaeretor mobilis]QDS97261.1 Spore protein SP21 [Adhaeretor mobilis]